MDQLDRIEQKIDKHVDSSNEKHTLVMQKLTALETNEKSNYKKITEHSDSIQELNDIKNKGKGALWIVTIIWIILTVGIPLLISLTSK